MKIISPIELNDSSTFTRASSAGYFGSDGKYAVASNDSLRLSYDPSLVATDTDYADVGGSFLVESAATNLLSYPRNYENSAWVKTRCTISSNQAGSELFGVQSVDYLRESVTGVTDHYLAQSATFVAGATYTFSLVAKADTRSHVALWAEAVTFATTQAVVFDLANGVVGSVASGTPTYSMKNLGNGWYRCSMTATATSSGASAFIIMLSTSSSGAGLGYVGDGVSGLFVGHAQVEAGNTSTSIIPDNTTFVSRASTKYEFDSSGVLTSYANDVAVTAYDPATLVSKGVSLEPVSTNSIRSNTSIGNWQFQAASGVVLSSVGSGTASGMEYFDFNVTGTSPATVPFNILFEQYGIITASIGQSWNVSVFLQLISGSPPTGGFFVGIDERDSSNTFLIGSRQTTAVGAGFERGSLTRIVNQPTVSQVSPMMTASCAVGESLNFTFRVFLPQCENISSTLVGPTSVIKTSGSAVTRAADISTSSATTRAADVLGTTNSIVVTNVPETDYTAWDNVTAYTIGTYVRYVTNNVHKVYRALTNNTNKNPTTNTADWLDAGSTNAWKMFDQSVQSQTTSASTIRVDILSKSIINNFTLLNVTGSPQIRLAMKHPVDGLLYDQTIDLTSFSGVQDWYTYFYAPIVRDIDFMFEGMPPYGDCTLSVEIKTNSSDESAGVGVCIFGNGQDYSAEGFGVEHGARLSIQDYSVKEQDDFGNYTILERSFARRANFTVYLEPENTSSLLNLLASRRARPTLYIGSTLDKHRCTIVYGFYKDFDIEIAYPSYSVCSIQLEGLT